MGVQGLVQKGLQTVDDSRGADLPQGGRSYQERQWELIHFLECRKYLARGSLGIYCQTQHGVVRGGAGHKDDRDGGENPRIFRITFLAKTGTRPCPVEGCSGQVATRTAIRVHFWHWHVQDTVVILYEGNIPHLRCSLCDILVP